MRRKFTIPTLLLAAALSCAAVGAAAPQTPARLGQPAPAFTLSDQNGKAVSLAEYSGKIVVLAWFNADCPFVQRHLKANSFNALAAKYKDKNVVLLAVDSTHFHTAADRLKAVQDWGLTFPVLNDSPGAVGHLYDAKTTPEMYVIGKDGVLDYKGGIDNDPNGTLSSKSHYVDEALDQLLAGKPVSVAETKSYGCSVKYAE